MILLKSGIFKLHWQSEAKDNDLRVKLSAEYFLFPDCQSEFDQV